MRAVAAGLCVLLGGAALPARADVPARHVEAVLGLWRAQGVASFYGPRFNGRRMACGRIFDQMASTAASLTLPCGTVVRVVNPRNMRSEIVVISDRGPYIRGRIIDLSLGTARRLGLERQGVALVHLEVLR